jgi:hypothetical protein
VHYRPADFRWPRSCQPDLFKARFAPGGAFVFAEGVHAFVKPDGHYMNEVWFYDIRGHRWICLYPGIEVKAIAQRIKDKDLIVNGDGLLVDREGQPLPPLLIHAYGYLSYDPAERKFVHFGSRFTKGRPAHTFRRLHV